MSLMPAPKDRPVQAMAYFLFTAVSEVEQSTDFGEGESDQTAVDGWRGFWCAWLVGWVFTLV